MDTKKIRYLVKQGNYERWWSIVEAALMDAAAQSATFRRTSATVAYLKDGRLIPCAAYLKGIRQW